jgi:hypothetical protein
MISGEALWTKSGGIEAAKFGAKLSRGITDGGLGFNQRRTIIKTSPETKERLNHGTVGRAAKFPLNNLPRQGTN